MQNNKYLIEEFEKDIWLFLDKDLSDERMKFWENQIENNEQIKSKFNEISSFLTEYKEFPSDEIGEQRLNRIIDETIKHEQTFSKIKSWIRGDDVNKTLVPKIAFATSLTLAAFVMLILSQKPNPINKLGDDVFEWNDHESTTRVQNINTTLSMIDNENLKNFILYRTMQDDWSMDIKNIENRIKTLDSKIDETSL